jgi:nucleoside-diphosphate-sugar epimerase
VISLVTGAAGFVGSHLCSALLDAGERVRAIDCFTDYYPRARKEQNLAPLLRRPGFSFYEEDLLEAPLASMLSDVGVVYHLAGQPGVRASWGDEFDTYLRNNVLATQRLLEATKVCTDVEKFVYASSSSVYGDAEAFPTPETARPAPRSPYGVTKLAAEHLCELYRANFAIPTASLRLFTVYGPGQRPDMAFARLVRAALEGTPFELYGDGRQTRDFTFVEDVVDAFMTAARVSWCGVANIGGGARTSMRDVLAILEGLCGTIEVVERPVQAGDVRDTSADTTLARSAFGYEPLVSLPEGLLAMVSRERTRLLEPIS